MKRNRKVGDLYRPNAYIVKMEDNVPTVLKIRGQKYILEGYEKKNL